MTVIVHKVIIIDPSEFEFNEELKDEYDLYALYHEGKELPDGVWVETWYLPEGQDPTDCRHAANHFLMQHQVYVLDWNELEDTELEDRSMQWTVDEWANISNELSAIAKAVEPLMDRGATISNMVRERLDPDDEQFYNEMGTGWRDDEALRFYAGMANDAVQKFRGVDTDVEEDEQ